MPSLDEHARWQVILSALGATDRVKHRAVPRIRGGAEAASSWTRAGSRCTWASGAR